MEKMKQIRLCRYGGLSPVKQKHYKTDEEQMSYHGAPSRYGFYSFLYPYIDWFFLTVETGKLKKHNEDKPLKNKRDRLTHHYRKFSVKGDIWTHLEPQGKLAWMIKESFGCWYRVDAENFPEIFNQYLVIDKKEYWRINKRYNGQTKPYYTVKNPYTLFSKDHLEIFVPKGTKIIEFK